MAALSSLTLIIVITLLPVLSSQPINSSNNSTVYSTPQKSNEANSNDSEENSSPDHDINIVYTPSVEKLLNGQIVINASSYYSYEFTLKDFSWARLEGNFTVSGDSGDCVRLYILDNANFSRWLVKESFDAVYDTGEVNAADLSVLLLPNTTYHIVFDNTFSSFGKEIDSQVNVLVQSK
ncbi:MAG: hypothetical protein NWE93_09180 [Candidatus Bathyarchaeota archaeon]|nr:hypothetical protein [Candidatus Bathyarchaeota archaeon]